MGLLAWSEKVVAAAAREFRLWARRPAEIFFCAMVPVFWTLVVWGLLGDGVMTRVPVALVDDDKSHLSRETGRALAACRSLGIEAYENAADALEAMRAGDLYGVIRIPFGYARDELTGRGGTLVIFLDETRYAAAGTLQEAIQNAATAIADERRGEKLLALGDGVAGAELVLNAVGGDFYALGNMQYSFLAFLGSCLCPAVIMIGAMLAFMTAILREEWRSGTRAWLMAAKGSFSAALLGKLLPHYGLFCLVFLFYIGLFAGWGGFAPTGSLAAWFACGAACLAVLAAMAIFIVAVVPGWRLALVVASGYIAPALPFSGFSIPMDSMTPLARLFAHCLPLTWLVQGQAQQWTLGSGFAQSGATFLAFSILFLLPLAIGAPLFKRKFAKLAKRTPA